MIKLFKDALKITNECIILATPLIIFMWALSLYIGFSKLSVNSWIAALLSFITVIAMTAAFCAGWFYMVKKAISLSKQTFVLETDKSKEIFNLIKILPAGIGKYFASSLGMVLLFALIIAVTGSLIFKLGMALIGNIGLDPSQISAIMSSSAGMKNFLDSLTFEQLMKLNNWNLLFISFTSLLSFILMLWVPEIIYKTRNPFIAIFKSIKKVFQKCWKSLKLFISISLINFVLSFINTFSVVNPIIYFVMMLVYFYFLVYLVVLIFLYYDREFVE